MTTIFLAGAEVERLTNALVDNGAKHLLYSYYFIHEMKREKFVERIQREHPEIEFLLDSGAFSYFNQMEKGRTLMGWREYKKLYFGYIGDTWRRWNRIAELDLDAAFEEITVEAVSYWLDQMLTAWPRAPIMPVWHTWRETDTWTEYCNDPRLKFLGISSKAQGDEGKCRRMVMQAKRAGKPVHGFGMTGIERLNLIPFDTVDSTSWLAGQQFGTLYLFIGNQFRVVAKKDMVGLGKASTPAQRRAHLMKGLNLPKSAVVSDETPADVLDEEAQRRMVTDLRIKRVNERRAEMTDRYSEMQKKKDRRFYAKHFTSIGCDPKLILDEVTVSRDKGDDGTDSEYRKACIAELRKANVLAWVALSRRMESIRVAQKRNLHVTTPSRVGEEE